MPNPFASSHRTLSKSFYLLLYAAIGAVVPFLSIYLKFLGMRADQIGAIIGVRPLVSAILCPVWGWIADKYRCRRSITLISILSWILFVTFLFLCPLIADVYEVSAGNHSDHLTNATGVDGVIGDSASTRTPPFMKRHWSKQKTKHPHRQHIKDRLKQEANTDKTGSLSQSKNGGNTEYGPKAKWQPSDISLPTETPNVNQSLSEIFESNVSNQERRFVFISLLIGFGAMQILLAPVFPIADAVALQSLGPDTSQWGLQRTMGSFGHGMSCALVGLVLTHVAPSIGPAHIGTELKRYLPAFCVAELFLLLAFLVATQVRFHMTDLRCHEYKVTLVSKMLASCSYGSFIATALYFGIAMGCMWTFLYWHLHNIGATYTQLGLATAASSIGEVIGFLTVSKLITKHGCAAMLVLALSCYSLRFIIYGYLTEPWLAVPTELLQGISFSLVWASSTFSVCGSTANKALASITGILYGILAGLGLAIGSQLAGLLITNYGAPTTFLYFAFATVCVLLVFLVTHLVTKRPLVQPDFPAEFSVSAQDLEKIHETGDSDDSDNIWAQS
ncbi:major facilitator superfamily domain-containing protein 6-A-like [Lineus longissimus]|uniref:major facilitator superfamily domain-containing protein 6-A-like n=1 Tax=Lineus longissimus TaxID=88925 RepID=UPI002B4FB167